MKRLLKLGLLLAVFAVMVGVLGTTAQAKKVGYSYRSLPKKMLGTWYTYTNFGYGKKKFYKIHLSNKNLRKNKKHKIYVGKKALKTSKYWTAIKTRKIHGYHWIWVYGWQQSAGAGTYYNLHKFGKHRVLTTADGAGVWSSTHYYRHKSVAKKLTNKHYRGFVYND